MVQEKKRMKMENLWDEELNIGEAIMQLKEMIVIIENHIEKQNGKEKLTNSLRD